MLIIIGLALSYLFLNSNDGGEMSEKSSEKRFELPDVRYESNTSVEEALQNRRSVRNFSDKPLLLTDVSQLLWAAQGFTDNRGLRTSPSAGALYPLEVYIIADRVDGLKSGIYKYNPKEHNIRLIKQGAFLSELSGAALGQTSVGDCSAALVYSAIYERTTQKYGDRGIKYVHMEVGHSAQNVCLQAIALNLSTVVVGAFNDSEVKSLINMPDEENPLYLIPIGNK